MARYDDRNDDRPASRGASRSDTDSRRRRVTYTSRAPSYYESDTASRRAGSPPSPPSEGGGRSVRALDAIVLALALGVIALFSIPYFLRSVPAAADPSAPAAPASSHPIITEVMAANRSAVCTQDGRYVDWIEITNPTNIPMNLGGYALSDDMKAPDRFVFPVMELPAGASVLVFASGDDSTGEELHAPFRLSSSGEMVVLYDNQDNPVDQVTFPALQDDESWARDPDDLTQWHRSERYTPGYPNTQDGWLAFSQSRRVSGSPVVINEVMSSNRITLADSEGDYWDWIEIYNSGDDPVDLTGYALSDNEGRLRKWVFPAVTLEPGQYRVIFASGMDKSDPQGDLHAGFRINGYGETILLSNRSGQILDSVALGELQSDTSYGRTAGGDEWQVFTAPTPGYPNDAEGFNAFQSSFYESITSPVIISEVMSANVDTLTDDSGENVDWIELYNRSDQAVNLSGYGLSNDSDALGKWTFPDVTLNAGDYLLVYADGRADLPADQDGSLHASFRLSATGKVLVLTDPAGAIADKCLLPALRADMSYGRVSGGMTFLYMDEPTPGSAASGGGWPGYTTAPAFVLPAGFYSGAQQVELQVPAGTRVYYTTDGSEPTQDSTPYGGPVMLTQTTVLRARAFVQGYLGSDTVTASYLIDTEHYLPVVSVCADPGELFDEVSGIMMMGPTPGSPPAYKGANFWLDKELPAYVELINQNGLTEVSQGVAFRIFGAYSRANDSKSFALMARGRYGDSRIRSTVPLFPDLQFTDFRSVVLRNGASEWNMAKMRDVVLTSLVADTTDLSVQAYRPVVLYLNAEYQGVYYIREKINKYYFEQHFGVSPESVNLLVGNGSVQAGSNKDYKALVQYARDNDLSRSEHYLYMQQHMDMVSFIDYSIVEMYTANTDTGNIKFWMSPEYDGKWRWVLYDLDWAFLTTTVDKDYIAEYIDPDGHGVSNMFDTTLIVNLLQNRDFKGLFLERFAYHINVTFNPERVIARVDQVEAIIEDEMVADRAKWGYSYVRWQAQVQYLRDFANKRPSYIKSHLKANFGLSDRELDALLSP